MSSSSNLYDVLGVSMVATGHEIKAAYRRLARTCHPDVVHMAVQKAHDKSTNDFLKIQSAYSTLSDPNKRATYDRDLLLSSRQQGGAAAAAAVFDHTNSVMIRTTRMQYSSYGVGVLRNWETDQCW